MNSTCRGRKAKIDLSEEATARSFRLTTNTVGTNAIFQKIHFPDSTRQTLTLTTVKLAQEFKGEYSVQEAGIDG